MNASRDLHETDSTEGLGAERHQTGAHGEATAVSRVDSGSSYPNEGFLPSTEELKSEKMTEVVSFRVGSTSRELLQAAASSRGTTVPELLRSYVFDLVDPDSDVGEWPVRSLSSLVVVVGADQDLPGAGNRQAVEHALVAALRETRRPIETTEPTVDKQPNSPPT